MSLLTIGQVESAAKQRGSPQVWVFQIEIFRQILTGKHHSQSAKQVVVAVAGCGGVSWR